jgi:hypothetical protein
MMTSRSYIRQAFSRILNLRGVHRMTGGAGQTGTAEPGAWFGVVISLLGGTTPNVGPEKYRNIRYEVSTFIRKRTTVTYPNNYYNRPQLQYFPMWDTHAWVPMGLKGTLLAFE